jgi:hypothetical protein
MRAVIAVLASISFCGIPIPSFAQNLNGIRSSSVRRPYSCHGVLRLRAIPLPRPKLQCNRIPNGKMVQFVNGDFFGKVRCATVRNAYNFSHTDPLRPVCCTEKKIPAAVERSCWFARGTCRELALV